MFICVTLIGVGAGFGTFGTTLRLSATAAGRTVVGSFSGAVVSVDLHVFLKERKKTRNGSVPTGTNAMYGNWK